MLQVTRSETNIVSLQAIANADGASNTLMIGEYTGITSPAFPEPDYFFAWMGSGSRPTYHCIPDSPQNVGWWDWTSKHSGMMVNFVMADGSVRAIRPTGGDLTSPEGGRYPHNPLTQAERAFWAASGYADGDITKSDGITP